MKTVSFNVRCANDPNGNSIAERAPRLKRILEKSDADLIGMQEVTPEWENLIRTYLGEKYELFHMYRGHDSLESVPILWKKDMFECIDKSCFWFSDTPETESRGWDEKFDVPRICTWVILERKKDGRRICYMNTHLGFGNNCQIRSVELIKKYKDHISDYPTIITGDFNMHHSTPTYKKMTEYFTDVNIATGRDMRPTFHGYGHKSALIDYCFIDENVMPVSYDILDETENGKYPSDHYGILSIVNI